MNLDALPAFADNYIWMLHDGHSAVVVDPGDAAPVHQALDDLGLELAAILVTHHHPDHVGGVTALHPRLKGPVWGPAHETIPPPCLPLVEGDTIEVLGLHFRVLDVPGHTLGHIAYVQTGVESAPLLFCGDTLFSVGCGKFLEGTPAQMSRSLAKLVALPGDARVCCTHEYTLGNLRFAAEVEPDNLARRDYEVRCRALRDAGRPTLPSTMALELRVNPFLRCAEPAVIAAAMAQGATSDDEVNVLATLREWKNRFR